MRSRSIFRVTNMGEDDRVWGVMVGWNPEMKISFSLKLFSRPENVKPNTRWITEVDLGATNPHDLNPTPFMPGPSPLANDGLGDIPPPTREAGLLEIATAEWVPDAWGCLGLRVHNERGREVHAFLSLRPHYCDRGHIQLLIDGDIDLDSHDSFPRFFFSTEEAKTHTILFLKWRLWKERTFEHKL